MIYITTPIYYPNAEPHIGTAYTTIVADTLTRYYRLRGEEVFFLTGTDENSLKVDKAAKREGISTKQYVDQIVERFKEYWEKLDIKYDDFIRTTEERHRRTVQYVFKYMMERGYIYRSHYEGWYCVHCETFWPKSKVGTEHRCPNPECGRELQWVGEENYFFKLSEFADKLLETYEANPDMIFPESRYNEVVSFIKHGLEDQCVSRSSVQWGIPIPDDPTHVVYVWFDALLNYISAIGYPYDMDRFRKYWPADLHLIGKDILRFHAVIWPAMLMALNLPLPRKIVAHGWLVSGGQKISKSRGGFQLTLKDLLQRFPADAIRYYLLREGSFGQDLEVSPEGFIERYNRELANDWGNLVSRVISMGHKYFKGMISKSEDKIKADFVRVKARYDNAIQEYRFSVAVQEILDIVYQLNAMVERERPWELNRAGKRSQLETLLWNLLEGIRLTAGLAYPIMPTSSKIILKQLGLNFDEGDYRTLRELTSVNWSPQTYTLAQKVIVFPRYQP